VIDEVAGMILSVLTLPRTAGVLVAAFVLFRVFDIWKPYPARQSQSLAGGLGVMIDDLIAGLYALLLLLASRAVLALPR
jgi:phosphatidylglycerophosphatase A